MESGESTYPPPPLIQVPLLDQLGSALTFKEIKENNLNLKFWSNLYFNLIARYESIEGEGVNTPENKNYPTPSLINFYTPLQNPVHATVISNDIIKYINSPEINYFYLWKTKKSNFCILYIKVGIVYCIITIIY